MESASLIELGQHLQQIRHQQGLSLSQLADKAGMAKSNLSRLEQGNGNPTLDTIWRLAVQLKMPFSELIAPLNRTLGEAGVKVKLIEQGQDIPKVDAYWMSLSPYSTRDAEPHAPGTSETITLISGKLDAGTLDNIHSLHAGETCTFMADKYHRYVTTNNSATFLVTITYHQATPHE